jgi:hypothetical protein
MPRGPETPIPIRAGILALHLFTDMNWVDISTKFLVHPDTAKKICQRAKVPLPPNSLPVLFLETGLTIRKQERATDDSVNALFAALGDAERTGRPRKHVDEIVEKMQVSEVPVYSLST